MRFLNSRGDRIRDFGSLNFDGGVKFEGGCRRGFYKIEGGVGFEILVLSISMRELNSTGGVVREVSKFEGG